MTIASSHLVKFAIIVTGLALFSSGCASMNSTSTTPTATLSLVNEKPLAVQQQQADPQKYDTSQHNPIVVAVCIGSGLIQIGNYLVGGE